MPMTLTEFLLARIAEDEAWARADAATTKVRGPRALPHVLRECGAKRAVLEQWDGLDPDAEDLEIQRQHFAGQAAGIDEIRTGLVLALSDVMRAMASPYADHRDFDPTWRLPATI